MTPKGSLPTPLRIALREDARGRYERGEQFHEIAAELNIKAPTLRSWARRDAWTRASESSSELAIAEPAEEIAYDMDLDEQAETYESDMRIAALKFSRHVKNLPADQIAAR